MIAIARLDSDDLQILRDVRRDRVAAARPGQLAERAALISALTPSQAEIKADAEDAREETAARDELADAIAAVERAHALVDAVSRRGRGKSHEKVVASETARARLRALTHPAARVVWEALIRAGFDAMSTPSSIVSLEDIREEIPPAEESRRWWFRPSVLERIRPVTSHASQVAFLEAVGAARLAVEGLAYTDLDDTATLAALRAVLDNVLRMQLPAIFHHVVAPLAALRRKLDAPALDLWTIAEEQIA